MTEGMDEQTATSMKAVITDKTYVGEMSYLPYVHDKLVDGEILSTLNTYQPCIHFFQKRDDITECP